MVWGRGQRGIFACFRVASRYLLARRCNSLQNYLGARHPLHHLQNPAESLCRNSLDRNLHLLYHTTSLPQISSEANSIPNKSSLAHPIGLFFFFFFFLFSFFLCLFFFFISPLFGLVLLLKFHCYYLTWVDVVNTNWFSRLECNVFCIFSLVAIGRYRPPYMLYLRTGTRVVGYWRRCASRCILKYGTHFRNGVKNTAKTKLLSPR